ncbi:MAG: 3-keto-disaccharide hydrolase [Verrucomicrobiia bacterium]
MYKPPAADPSARTTRQLAHRPTQPIKLFNGRNLDGLYSWLVDSKFQDPKKVFTVRDGALRISGEEFGCIATKKAYRDYHLIAEFKWGEKIFGNPRTVRNSGILMHATGPDGNRPPWMASIECQLAQGCVGDFIVIPDKQTKTPSIPVDITSDTTIGEDGRTRWKTGGTPTNYSGRQFWWSKHDPEFKERIDTHGRWDVESPLNEWTRVECVCAGGRITVIVNGVTVNECYDVWPFAGKILLEVEGYEILFRKFELHPLKQESK